MALAIGQFNRRLRWGETCLVQPEENHAFAYHCSRSAGIARLECNRERLHDHDLQGRHSACWRVTHRKLYGFIRFHTIA
jgi:hypothetical protein